MTRKQNAAALVKQLAALLEQSDAAANDDEPVIDEQAIRERARADAERMKRARKR